jgi:hypothetical protein
MKTRPYLAVAILAIAANLACSCCDKNDKVIVDIYNCVQPSELLEPDFEVIPLETIDESIISYIERVKTYNNRFYIQDREQKVIFIFDENGKYINKINRLGRGPGEYIYINDFDIYNDYIYILSVPKILRYDLNGKYIDCIEELDDSYYNFIVMSEDSVLLFVNSCGNTGMNYKIFDWKSNKILAEFDNYGEYKGMGMQGYHMNRTNDGILLSKSFDHTLYKYDKSGYNKLVELDFPGTDEIPETPVNYFEKSKYITTSKLEVISCFNQSMIYNGKLYIDFNITTGREHNGLIVSELKTFLTEIDIDTKTSRTIEIGYLKEYDDYPFIGSTVAMQDGKMITEEHCVGIVKYRSQLMTQYPELANIKEDDNPILIVHHIRK